MQLSLGLELTAFTITAFNNLLKEDGGNMLLESGGYLLLEQEI